MPSPPQVRIRSVEPGIALFNAVRAAFIARGASFSGWCAENGVTRQGAVAALTGAWNGPKGRALRQRLIEASGLKSPA